MKLKTKYHYIIMSAERNDTVSLTRFMDPKGRVSYSIN